MKKNNEVIENILEKLRDIENEVINCYYDTPSNINKEVKSTVVNALKTFEDSYDNFINSIENFASVLRKVN